MADELTSDAGKAGIDTLWRIGERAALVSMGLAVVFGGSYVKTRA